MSLVKKQGSKDDEQIITDTAVLDQLSLGLLPWCYPLNQL